MRILMLSWRSPMHPAAGGAEVVTAAVLRRFAADGHDVWWFSGAYPGGKAEVVDGIRHIRSGEQWSVHLNAWRWLRARLDRFDRIVDQINTIPFFTPLYVPAEKRRFFIHQLAREYWWRETRGAFRAVAPLGYAAEPLYLRAYRGTRGITVSESTRSDLAALGIRDVTVVPQALDIAPVESLDSKPDGPLRVVMVSRLTPAKFFEEGLRAFAIVQQRVPDATLDVIGDGDPSYRARLERLARELGLRDVAFHGRVELDRRRDLVRRAHVHLFASHREGWGLVVSEAGADGTPSVGYDAPGVRDSIGEPAQLAPTGDHGALARRVLALWDDRATYDRLRHAAWERAGRMSPDETARVFWEALQ